MQFNRNQFLAPMDDICQTWQMEKKLKSDWFFNQVKSLDAERALFHSVSVETPLFDEINNRLKQESLGGDFIFGVKEFLQIPNLEELLKEGIGFTLLFSSPVTPQLIERIKKYEEYLDSFKFVIIGRKDWNVRNTYRSIPHFMRSQLFVDFPVSLHSSDPYYSTAELADVVPAFEKDFLDGKVRSFSPNLSFYTGEDQNNISHFSIPRKLSKNKPFLSIVASEPQLVSQIAKSAILAQNPEKVEILITRIAGQKTQVIPKIKSVLTTRYWAHLKDPNGPVSQALLENFSAGQASGEYVLFLDETTANQFDSFLLMLFEGGLDEKVSLKRGRHKLFKASLFRQIGGVDQAFTNPDAMWLDARLRYLRLFEDSYSEDLLSQYLEKELGSQEDAFNRKMLIHKYVELKKFNLPHGIQGEVVPNSSDISKKKEKKNKRYQAEQARARYLSLYKSSPKVAIEGNLSYLLLPFVTVWKFLKHNFRMHSWRLNLKTYKAYWRTKTLIGKPKHFAKMHSWKITKFLMAPWNFISSHIWRVKNAFLKPWYFVKKHMWRLHPLISKPRHWIKLHSWRVKNTLLRPWHFGRKHIFWRFNPKTYTLYWRLEGYASILLGKAQGIYWSYRSKLMAPYHLVKKQIWRLNPRAYKSFWLVKEKLQGPLNKITAQLWRLDPRVYKFYWTVAGVFSEVFGALTKSYWWLRGALVKPFHLLKQNLWRLKLSSYKSYWKLKSSLNIKSYPIYWKAKKTLLLPFNFVGKNYWRLDPRIYKPFWDMVSYFEEVKGVLVKVSTKAYWGVRYCVSAPFHALRRHYWRLDPRVYKWYWSLVGAINSFISGAKWLVRQASWKLNPRSYDFYWNYFSLKSKTVGELKKVGVRVYWKLKNTLEYPFHFIKSNYWKLDPRVHEFYWSINGKIRDFFEFGGLSHWVRCNLWRVRPQQLGWYFFRILFPVRKIYYFSRFQYEKRILGLHKKKQPEQVS